MRLAPSYDKRLNTQLLFDKKLEYDVKSKNGGYQMQARMGKIPIKKGKEQIAKDYLSKLLENNDIIQEMNQKGYFWDCLFFKEENHQTYLYVIAKSKDWSKIKGTKDIQVTPARAFYDKFIAECWDQEEPYITDSCNSFYTLNELWQCKDIAV